MVCLGHDLCLLLVTTIGSSLRTVPDNFGLRAMKGSVYIAMTVDGKIAGPDGDTSFLDDYNSANCEDEMGFADFLRSVDVIIMGRSSFEKVVSFGREMWAYGSIPVVVWSRNGVDIPEHLKESVSSSSLSPKTLFDQLEEQGKNHAYIDGGFTVRSFLNVDLIDQMIITRVPLLLGDGISLFDNGGRKVRLDHLKTQAYPNGLVQTTYRLGSES